MSFGVRLSSKVSLLSSHVLTHKDGHAPMLMEFLSHIKQNATDSFEQT